MSPQLISLADQSSSPSSANRNSTRIRDNQRRSRARRKEYLQELEAKLRKCEELGVQASVDIQVAARAVSAENARLREENGRLKDENERLKAKLRIEDHPMPAVVIDGHNEESAKASVGLPITTAEPGYVVAGNVRSILQDGSLHPRPKDAGQPIQTNNSNFEPPVQAPASSPHTTPVTLQAPPGTHDVPNNPLATHPSHRPSESKIQPPTEGQCTHNKESSITDDTSSCEYAAQIITSMRADVSTEDIRVDLGCGPDVQEWRKCKVNNAKLFVAMDRYTR